MVLTRNKRDIYQFTLKTHIMICTEVKTPGLDTLKIQGGGRGNFDQVFFTFYCIVVSRWDQGFKFV